MPNGMIFSLYVELLTCCSLVTMMRPKGLSNSSFYVLGLSIILFIMLCDNLGFALVFGNLMRVFQQKLVHLKLYLKS